MCVYVQQSSIQHNGSQRVGVCVCSLMMMLLLLALTTARHPHFQGLATVGVGDLVRDQVKRGTPVGKELKVRDTSSSSSSSTESTNPLLVCQVKHSSCIRSLLRFAPSSVSASLPITALLAVSPSLSHVISYTSTTAVQHYAAVHTCADQERTDRHRRRSAWARVARAPKRHVTAAREHVVLCFNPKHA